MVSEDLLFIFLGIFAYSCLYFAMVFLTHFWEYLVVILRVCLFAI